MLVVGLAIVALCMTHIVVKKPIEIDRLCDAVTSKGVRRWRTLAVEEKSA